jgi:hypothetical protein
MLAILGSTAVVIAADAQAASPPRATLRYVSFGGRPALFPKACPSEPVFGLFGVCLYAPKEKLRQVFGLEDQRVALDKGHVELIWRFLGVNVTAELDKVGSTVGVHVSLPPNSNARVALPRGLILGASTFAQARRALGGPPRVRRFEGAESNSVYTYSWYSGCMGGCFQTFSWSGAISSANPFDRFPRDIESRRPDFYGICDGSISYEQSC